MTFSNWWGEGKTWDWWESVFQIHYGKNYKNFEIASFEEDYYNGTDVFIDLNVLDKKLRVQLKSNKSTNISDLPIHLAYKNEKGFDCAFGRYFSGGYSLDTFMFGYPYSNVCFVVRGKALNTVWNKNFKKWKSKYSRKGQGKNEYIAMTLGEFQSYFLPTDSKIYTFAIRPLK